MQRNREAESYMLCPNNGRLLKPCRKPCEKPCQSVGVIQAKTPSSESLAVPKVNTEASTIQSNVGNSRTILAFPLLLPDVATPWWRFVSRLSSAVFALVVVPPLSDMPLQGRQHQGILRFWYVNGEPAPASGSAVLACPLFEIFGHYRQLLLGCFFWREQSFKPHL
jgi:hypothetical protein